MPRLISRAIGGGLVKVIHTRLHRSQEEGLEALAPELWRWVRSYGAPPRPLRRPRRAKLGEPERVERPASRDRAERILDAATARIAAEGYLATTMGAIAAAAGVSPRTLAKHFDDKAEVMGAAFDRGQARMLAAALPAARRAKDWPGSVRAAIAAMLAFLTSEPDFARLGLLETYGAGAAVLERRDRTLEAMQSLLEPGLERAPGLGAIAGEGIGGAIYSLMHDEVRARGPEGIEAVLAPATFLALAPFLGAEQACAVANGGG
jgi:AcrR family transcriptional regulator